MKVKCIRPHDKSWYQTIVKKGFWKSKSFDKDMKGPKYGDIVTVKEDYWKDGKQYYRLIEWPNGFGYAAKGFEPIDDEKEQFEEVKFEKIKETHPASIN